VLSRDNVPFDLQIVADGLRPDPCSTALSLESPSHTSIVARKHI